MRAWKAVNNSGQWCVKFIRNNAEIAQVIFNSQDAANLAGENWTVDGRLPEPLIFGKCPTCGKDMQ